MSRELALSLQQAHTDRPNPHHEFNWHRTALLNACPLRSVPWKPPAPCEQRSGILSILTGRWSAIDLSKTIDIRYPRCKQVHAIVGVRIKVCFALPCFLSLPIDVGLLSTASQSGDDHNNSERSMMEIEGSVAAALWYHIDYAALSSHRPMPSASDNPQPSPNRSSIPLKADNITKGADGEMTSNR